MLVSRPWGIWQTLLGLGRRDHAADGFALKSHCGILYRWCARGKRWYEGSAEFGDRMCLSIGSHRGSGDRFPEDDGRKHEIGRTYSGLDSWFTCGSVVSC